MVKEFEHYGKTIKKQVLTDRDKVWFKEYLEQNGVEYTYLPLLDEEVIKYEYKGKEKYAYLYYPNVQEAYIQEVYIMENIPDDLNFYNIVIDCDMQEKGEEPMRIASRAKVLYKRAYDIAKERDKEEGITPKSFIDFLKEPVSIKNIRAALTELCGVEEIMKMPHEDVPQLDEFYKKIKKEGE